MHAKDLLIPVTITLVSLSAMVSAAERRASEPASPTAREADSAPRQEADYLAAVKKCEVLEPKEKQHCIETAKERYGEMLR